MYIVLLGAPGVGKGTQGVMLSESYNIPRFSTGEILREAISKEDVFSKQLQNLINHGELVPDEVVERIVSDRLKRGDCISGFILDGFPRTVGQAYFLSSLISDNDVFIINIEVDQEILLQRLTNRVICKKCGASCSKSYIEGNSHSIKCKECCGIDFYQRDDDKRDAVERRLETYSEKTRPVVDYYKSFAKFININGEDDIDEVFKKIMYKMTELLKK